MAQQIFIHVANIAHLRTALGRPLAACYSLEQVLGHALESYRFLAPIVPSAMGLINGRYAITSPDRCSAKAL